MLVEGRVSGAQAAVILHLATRGESLPGEVARATGLTWSEVRQAVVDMSREQGRLYECDDGRLGWEMPALTEGDREWDRRFDARAEKARRGA